METKLVRFRFSEETMARLEWLGRYLDLNRSQVVRLAVAELYNRYRRMALQEAVEKKLLLTGEEVRDRPAEVGLPDTDALNVLTLAWMRGEPERFWAGYDVATLAEEQAVQPVQRLDDLWGDFWPEDESIDDFIKAVRRWRHEGLEHEE